MNENLDLTQVLKDCPKGTTFYSTIFGDVYFQYVSKDINDVYCINFIRSEGSLATVTVEGKHFIGFDGECTLFPSKDQRDWSKWHRPFKDGDVVTYKLKGSLVAFIYKERITTTLVKSHFALYIQNMGFCIDGDIALKEEDIVFATEEEKQKLFDAIKTNGYKWNAETKTLEKLVVPKFKVGDRIKHRLTGDVYRVLFILSNECGGGVYNVVTTNEIGKIIDIEEQDNYELLPNKFDPENLKPFDKLLCRMNNDDIWGISLFERYAPTNPYPFFCIQDCFSQCVPYNEETKHLLGTNNEAPEYYKCWED